MWGFEGVGHKKNKTCRMVCGKLVILNHTFLIGKIKAKPHPFVEYFKFWKQFEDENTVSKYTIPSLGQTLQQMFIKGNYENTRNIYPTNEEFINDKKKYIKMLLNNSICRRRNLQFDDVYGCFN